MRVAGTLGESLPSLGLSPAIQVDTSAEVDLSQVIARLDHVLAT
jgi:hypothetical protein